MRLQTKKLELPPEPHEVEPQALARLRLPAFCAVLPGHRAMLGFPRVALIVSLRTGAVLAAHSTRGLSFLRLAKDPKTALFHEDGEVFALDTASGSWRAHSPGGPTACMQEMSEEAWLVDPVASTTARLVEVLDHPRHATSSPDGRFLWVEDSHDQGGVYATRTGLRQLDVRGWTATTPGLSPRAEEALARSRVQRSDRAITLDSDARWRVVDQGRVLRDGSLLGTLTIGGAAVSVDARGTVLLELSSDTVFELAFASGLRVKRQWSFAALLPLVTLRWPGLRLASAVRASLIASFGSGFGVVDGTIEQIVATGRLSARGARRLKAACRRELRTAAMKRVI